MNRPIILDYSTKRTESQRPIFQYSYENDMAVVNIGEEHRLFIEVDTNSPELLTKTFVERESDDTPRELSELMTKTRVARESDDDTFNCIELVTLTKVSREGDDD